MKTSLLLACVWVIAANVIAMLPSRRNHWPQAYVLIALGVPLLGYVTYQYGPFVGLIALAGGASILRWPLFHLGRRVRRRLVKSAK